MLADLANLDLDRCDGAKRGRSMLAFGTVQQSNHCAREEFLYELKAGPAGGRLRRPSSRRQRHVSPRSSLTLRSSCTVAATFE
jgi:hypothetical protein